MLEKRKHQRENKCATYCTDTDKSSTLETMRVPQVTLQCALMPSQLPWDSKISDVRNEIDESSMSIVSLCSFLIKASKFSPSIALHSKIPPHLIPVSKTESARHEANSSQRRISVRWAVVRPPE
ncbi:hypothetical protein M758_6G203500 [Ceratodon purpureus]|uniref:Uncharacterized protein n=1 Tax=Ceratodon purpureus TaxID=3225 RepID=A0A8T0HK05_CERPU|nr:hypothetical protein KC19_6G212600 [Ceratodon purpureus]KAG0614791.1 hypothetical protein M758_6G203500 [Ceratodon purpureus]